MWEYKFSCHISKKNHALFLVTLSCHRLAAHLCAQCGKRNAERAPHPTIERQVVRKSQLRGDFITQHESFCQSRADVLLSPLIDKMFDRHPLLVSKGPIEIAGVHVMALGDFL